jgi:hypothetical protein
MLTIAGLLGLVGLIALHGLSPRPRAPVPRHEAVRRILRHIARRSIRDLVEGEAAVVRGTAIAIADPLIAPLTGRPCIGYHLQILSFDGEVLVDRAGCTAFAVADDTGEIAVRAEGLEFAAIEAPMVTALWPPPLHIRNLIPAAQHGHVRYYTEGVLLPGASVGVCGVLYTPVIAGDLYREAKVRRELIASPMFPLVASSDSDLAVPSPRPVRPEDLRR